ncbi:MAG: hypothetical protein HKL88_06750 [Bacteroidia bacterium]|nr:hypothetical protein [Bacteroidia bacterium]
MIDNKFEILMEGHTGVIKLKNGEYASYKVIRTEGDRFVHYTGRGIRELFTMSAEVDKLRKGRLEALNERNLVFSRHIATTLYSEIEEIIS